MNNKSDNFAFILSLLFAFENQINESDWVWLPEVTINTELKCGNSTKEFEKVTVRGVMFNLIRVEFVIWMKFCKLVILLMRITSGV